MRTTAATPLSPADVCPRPVYMSSRCNKSYTCPRLAESGFPRLSEANNMHRASSALHEWQLTALEYRGKLAKVS